MFFNMYQVSGKERETYEQTEFYHYETCRDCTSCSTLLCIFYILQIKIPVPGGDATSLHIGNTFCVLGALLLGGWYGGLAGSIGMTIADLMDPVYITGAPKTFCPEALHRSYNRSCSPQDCKDQ